MDSNALTLLRSISMTLSDVQMQLSTIQQQNTQRDETLRQLEIDIKDIKGSKRAGANIEETPKSKRRRKSPPGLCVSNSFDIKLDYI